MDENDRTHDGRVEREEEATDDGARPVKGVAGGLRAIRLKDPVNADKERAVAMLSCESNV